MKASFDYKKIKENEVLKQMLQEIGTLWPAIKGSLAQVRKPCIRKTCPACARGDKHPNWLLAFTKGGKRRCLYVPEEMVSVLQQALKNGRKMEQLLYSVGPLMIREYRRQRKNTKSS